MICEVMNPDGTMARRPELETFAQEHGLVIISVADLIRYRLLKETMVQAVAEVEVDIEDIGRFKVITYQTEVDDLEHLAIVKGQPLEDEPTLGRVQQENVLSDVFRCGARNSRWNLEFALREMEKAGCVLVILKPLGWKMRFEAFGSGTEAPCHRARCDRITKRFARIRNWCADPTRLWCTKTEIDLKFARTTPWGRDMDSVSRPRSRFHPKESKKERSVSAPRNVDGQLNASGHKYAFVVARFNSFIVEQLVNGAIGA